MTLDRWEPYWESMDAAWEAALSPLRSGEAPASLLFSGGVDSSLLAWELRDRPALRLTTIGLPSSADLKAAKAGAERLGLPWDRVLLRPEEVLEMAQTLAPELHGLSRTARSVLVAISLALQRAAAPMVFCGQGADELFLGYAHFRGLDPDAAARRAESDLARLVGQEWPLTQRLAARWGKTAVAPYLDPGFIRAVGRVPVRLRLPGLTPKGLLRAWAVHRGLPPDLATPPKRALQYGSGVDRVLRRRDRASMR